MDLLTAVLVIIVILLVYRLTKDHDMSYFTDDGMLERGLVSLAAGAATWWVLGKMHNDPNITGGDGLEDNVVEPSNLSIDEY